MEQIRKKSEKLYIGADFQEKQRMFDGAEHSRVGGGQLSREPMRADSSRKRQTSRAPDPGEIHISSPAEGSEAETTRKSRKWNRTRSRTFRPTEASGPHRKFRMQSVRILLTNPAQAPG